MTWISEGCTALNAPASFARDTTVNQLMRPIFPHLDRPEVFEITVNSPGELWARTFEGWQVVQVPELTMAHLRSLATAIAVFNSISLHSIVSVILPGGQRGQIVLPPACIEGTLSLMIRKSMPLVKTLDELAAEGAFDSANDVSFNRPTVDEVQDLVTKRDFTRLAQFEADLLTLKREGRWKEFLDMCVSTRRNMIIAGKTGSGKTTFARSLIERIPSTERLLTIEDVHELCLENHPNRVHMLYGYGKGRVTAVEALRSAMRQSPDRIFLAELRGDEAWEYLGSANTGHPGSITTIHANNAIQTYQRAGTLIKQSEVGRTLDMELINRTLYSTIDVVLYFSERKLCEVFYDPIFAKKQMI